MQHSQLRAKDELVKLFSHQNPTTVQKTLKVLKYDGSSVVDITPAYTVSDLNTGYFSTEIVTPKEDVYLLILFCGNPIVLRVGVPPLQFLYFAEPLKTIPYKHFDEFGAQLDSGNLTELQDGFYHKGPISLELGYIEVFRKPYIISVPYCGSLIGVYVQVIWNKKVISRKFGTKVVHQVFRTSTMKQGFGLNTVKQMFNLNTDIQAFNLKTNSVTFKAIKA